MKKILIIMIPLAILTSCVDSLIEDGYNRDPKNASEAPPETLFTNALKNFSDVLTTPNVNTNNFRLYVQHWSTTTYLQEPRYDMTSRTIPQALWQTMYRDVIADLKEARRLLEADQFIDPTLRDNQLAQIEIMEVYAWSALVNAFGNVPYSEAFIYEKPLPKYDDAETIYLDILSRLDAAIASIDAAEDGFGSGDVLYEGDMGQWTKFGNSLMIKLAMVIADVSPEIAGPYIEAAATNVFASNKDNARFPYLSAPPNNNPLSQNLNPLYSQRQDYVIADTLVGAMNLLNDPRRIAYFTDVDGAFKGGEYGFVNDYPEFSHVSEIIIDPELEALLLDYSEVEFLLAEAIERGFNVAGIAGDHYTNAIQASMEYWGVEKGDPAAQEAVVVGVAAAGQGYAVGDIVQIQGGTSSQVTEIEVLTVDGTGKILTVAIATPGAYSVLPADPEKDGLPVTGAGTGARFNVVYNGGYSTYLADPAVDYDLAPGDYKQKIGLQKWLALYNRGFDAWVEWKRLDFPKIEPPSGEGIAGTLVIPTRLIYPINEQTLNGASRDAAASAIGGDLVSTKLFWDVN